LFSTLNYQNIFNAFKNWVAEQALQRPNESLEKIAPKFIPIHPELVQFQELINGLELSINSAERLFDKALSFSDPFDTLISKYFGTSENQMTESMVGAGFKKSHVAQLTSLIRELKEKYRSGHAEVYGAAKGGRLTDDKAAELLTGLWKSYENLPSWIQSQCPQPDKNPGTAHFTGVSLDPDAPGRRRGLTPS